MIRLQRILYPTDFSQHSRPACDYACALAEQFGAQLHVLSVVQDMQIVMPEPGSLFSVPAVNMDEARDSAEIALKKWIDPAWVAKNNVAYATRVGTPFVEIVRYAREHEIDLIVIGTHGRSGLVHVLLGSVAERVVRKAACPVLTVRPTDHNFVMP